MALEAEPVGVDPHRYSDFHTATVLANVYDGLTALDAQLRVQPALAASWETPSDSTWIFRLRPGVRFHDGRALSADDVVFSFDRARRLPQTDAGIYLVAVQAVRVIDPLTVEITTQRPAATLLNKLAFVSIVPQGSPDEIRQPVGTGPYRFVSYAPGKPIELQAFAAYWGRAPAFKSVWMLPLADEEERVRRLLSGAVDLAPGLSPQRAAKIRQARGCRVLAQDGSRVVHLVMRVDHAPFSDLRVRQAVSLAIDRSALVEQMLTGQGRVANQVVTSNNVGFAPDLPALAQDLARARRLLAAAGFPGGLDLDLEYRDGAAGAAAIQAQLAAAGIRVRPLARRWEDLYPRALAGQVRFYMLSTVLESGDASDFLDPSCHTRGTMPGYGDQNWSGYSNRELDALIEKSAVTLDPLRRREILQRCVRMLSDDLPTAPLFAAYDLYGVRSGVEWKPRLDGTLLAQDMRRSAEN